MFITNDAFRSPISSLLGNPAEQYWAAAELALCRPWFLVTFRHTQAKDDADAFEMTRTMLLSNVKDIECWVQQEKGGSLQLESVLLVSPGPLNGTQSWKMEPLSAVWTAEEPSAAGQVVDIYETKAGVKYARSMLDTPIEDLHNETLRFRFTAREKRPGRFPH
ncbi:MAG: hypothetical protein Q7K57_56455 [Burkholderiaceae bacterium]|nr:hypothetical protein [Burkholderiaceae bacterium]